MRESHRLRQQIYSNRIDLCTSASQHTTHLVQASRLLQHSYCIVAQHITYGTLPPFFHTLYVKESTCIFISSEALILWHFISPFVILSHFRNVFWPKPSTRFSLLFRLCVFLFFFFFFFFSVFFFFFFCLDFYELWLEITRCRQQKQQSVCIRLQLQVCHAVQPVSCVCQIIFKCVTTAKAIVQRRRRRRRQVANSPTRQSGPECVIRPATVVQIKKKERNMLKRKERRNVVVSLYATQIEKGNQNIKWNLKMSSVLMISLWYHFLISLYWKEREKKVIIPGGRRKFHVAPHIGELSKDIKYEKI